MIVNDKKNFIKKMKLDSNVNKFIFAKSLFALKQNVSLSLIRAVASAVMNRFIYEAEISEEKPDIVRLLTRDVFSCWKNCKAMDVIDVESPKFKDCLCVATQALKGDLDDDVCGAISFHKSGSQPVWLLGLLPEIVIEDFCFYNVCS